MAGRFVEIATDNRRLSIDRGFLVVSDSTDQIGRIPLDDISALIANAHGLTYSNTVLLELSRRGAPVVLCGPNHRPQAFVWPVDGHHVQALRMRLQLQAGEPAKKRLWRRIVSAKIRMQAAVLDCAGRPNGALLELAKSVKSGDPDNFEAQAARRYWPLLLGDDFRRDRDAPGLNGVLNYGYTILRAATARAVMGAGFHASLGLHHHNRSNPMCLIDDLMEPYRPLVDLCTLRLRELHNRETVDPFVKSALAKIIDFDLPTDKGASPVSACLERMAQSLAECFQSSAAEPALPDLPSPLDLAELGR